MHARCSGTTTSHESLTFARKIYRQSAELSLAFRFGALGVAFERIEFVRLRTAGGAKQLAVVSQRVGCVSIVAGHVKDCLKSIDHRAELGGL